MARFFNSPSLVHFVQLVHDHHPGFDLSLHLFVGRRQAVHLDPAELVEAVAVAVAVAHPLARHPSLQMLDHIPGPHVDALEDVHLCRGRRVRVRFRLEVADGVDEDVVVELLRVGAREGGRIANESRNIIRL